MAIVQAIVPTTNLATAIGTPNALVVEYSTNVLLPVPGPMYFFWLRRSFLRSLLALNEFMVFVEKVIQFSASGKTLNLELGKERSSPIGLRRWSRFDSTIGSAATKAMKKWFQPGPIRPDMTVGGGQQSTSPAYVEEMSLLERLSWPNFIYREAFESGLITESNLVISDQIQRAKTFQDRSKLVLQALLSTRTEYVPDQLKETLRTIANEVLEMAAKNQSFLVKQFDGISGQTKSLLIQWMVAQHLSSTQSPAATSTELKSLLGFVPLISSREWAFRREERLEMTFGTPDLRGPVGAEALPPQGETSREDFSAMQQELTLIAAERRQSLSREQTTLGIGDLQRRLNTVYYAGPGDVNQLTSQAMTSVLNEQMRNNVLAILREVSESRENVRVELSRQSTSTTISHTSKGIDQKKSATHHRFKVVVPVKNTVFLHDVGLTWCPRITNPFLPLRQAARDAWNDAYTNFKSQYYVPEPVRPHIVSERVDIMINVTMEGEESVTESFTYALASTDREERPDFDNASVVWEQNEGFWNDDPDYWVIYLSNLRFSGGIISGEVTAETGDGGADFEGTAKIVIPVLRYSQETVNNLAEYEAELVDYNLKLQALSAQACQYANIKRREFIDYHASEDAINKTLLEALVKRSCAATFYGNLSYYKEIISRCVDWDNAKIEFESAPIDQLYYPQYPPDHFMNSRAVRFFMPIFRNAEAVLFDVLTSCGSFFTRTSVQSAQNRIMTFRNNLSASGPQKLLEFDGSLVIGEHVEAVLSNHDLAQ